MDSRQNKESPVAQVPRHMNTQITAVPFGSWEPAGFFLAQQAALAQQNDQRKLYRPAEAEFQAISHHNGNRNTDNAAKTADNLYQREYDIGIPKKMT